MKKIFVLYLTLAVLCLSLAGCNGNSTKTKDNGNGSNPVAQEPQSGGGDNVDTPVKNSGIENITITENNLTTVVPELAQTVVYENVEMRRYEKAGGSHPAHPYIHNIRTNNTSITIIEYQRGMLAYDKDGQPLKIDWYTLDRNIEQTFSYLDDRNNIEILSGETDDGLGGWSLNYWGEDLAVEKIAYVLYCDKEITFEDGTVWINPDFEEWLNTYEGKTIDVNVLENYYPYVQTIVF